MSTGKDIGKYASTENNSVLPNDEGHFFLANLNTKDIIPDLNQMRKDEQATPDTVTTPQIEASPKEGKSITSESNDEEIKTSADTKIQ